MDEKTKYCDDFGEEVTEETCENCRFNPETCYYRVRM